MTFPTTYQTDGVTTDWSFDWPFLDRSDVFVTVNEAARAFTFIDDGTVRCVDSLGNPFAKGLPLVINRATPDLVALAQFKDAANLTAADLNRARLQLLFLIQERSGGMAGAVGTVISNLSNEITTISGALDDIGEIRGVLEADLDRFKGLPDRMTAVENGAQALLEQIQQEIDNRIVGDSTLSQRLDSMDLKVGNLSASVQSDITLLQSGNSILAAQTSKLQAEIDNLAQDDSGQDAEAVAASLITAAIASVKKDSALVQSITTLEAAIADATDSTKKYADALVQTEQEARVSADAGLDGRLGTLDDNVTAMSKQITTVQSSLGDQIAGVSNALSIAQQSLQTEIDAANGKVSANADAITRLQTTLNDSLAGAIQQIQTQITAINGNVTDLESQYTLKVYTQRGDGTPIIAGIGLASTQSDQYVGSEVVLMGDKVLFADPNNLNGDLIPFLESGIVDGAATLVIPSTFVGDKSVPGRVLVDGSIEARTIAANTITGDKLVAGTISTDRLDVGMGVNLLKNSTFVQGLVEWTLGWTSTAGVSASTEAAGVDLNADWTATGLHIPWLHSTANPGTTDINQAYNQLYSSQVAVLASSYYEFSVYAGVSGSNSVDVGINWYDASGAYISNAGFSGAGAAYATSQALPNGHSLTNFVRLGGIAQAPVNAASALLVIRKSFAASGDSWAFLAQPMIAETHSTATRLAPYSPSGLGTLITPAGISTPSLAALSATIGTLRTATSGARMELSDNQLSVYDSNNVRRVLLGIW